MSTRVVKAFCLLLPLLFYEGKAGDPCKKRNCSNCCSTISSTSYPPIPCTSSLTTATSPGAIIGAAFGGADCGLTVTIVVLMCMGRKSSFFKKTQPTFFGKKIPVRQINDENQQTSSRDLNTKSVVYNEINDDLQRVVRTMQQQEASGIKEGVYNHLHSADQKDRSDYYDHAGPSFLNTEEGYGVLPSDSKSNGNYSKVDPSTTPDCDEPMASKNVQTSKENNEYFTLEASSE